MALHKKDWVLEMAKNTGMPDEEIAEMIKELELPRTDWAVEMAKNGRMPATNKEFAEMAKQMDDRGLKGAYNPKNLYPGSPFEPSSFPSAKEVRQQAKSGSQKVLSDWNMLRKIVERHHEVLEKRWVKKTKKKQKEMLLQAWPNMSSSHRPDYEAYRNENTGRHWQGLSNYQESYKWPYINQQDLSSRSLIVFINSRACNPPSMFARADLDATRLGSIGHFIPEPAFLKGYTLFMDGETIETYGKLVSWDDDEKAADLMFSQRQFTPGDGLRVFELQERVYPFLILSTAVNLFCMIWWSLARCSTTNFLLSRRPLLPQPPKLPL
jgi:hypothetical protein